MQFNYESDTPLYLQVAEQLENGILSGAFEEEGQIPSTTEISVSYRINPATVLKGVTMMGDVLYKKRGIGMFVAKGAREKLRSKRKNAFFVSYIKGLLEEAAKLQIGREELIQMIREEKNNE